MKTVSRLSSPSHKTNGSPIKPWRKNLKFKVIKLREASVMKSTGRRAKISLSRLSRRKTKIKRKPFKKKLNLFSIFLRKSIWLKMMRKIRMNPKKMKMKKMIKYQNLKDNTKSQMSFMKTWSRDLLSTFWEWLEVISETSVISEICKESKKAIRMRRKRLQRRRKEREREKGRTPHQEEMNEKR